MFEDLIKFFCGFSKIMKIKFFWWQILVILIIHKPMRSQKIGPYRFCCFAVYWLRTNRQTSKVYVYIIPVKMFWSGVMKLYGSKYRYCKLSLEPENMVSCSFDSQKKKKLITFNSSVSFAIIWLPYICLPQLCVNI